VSSAHVTVGLGQDVTCTVTNDDNAARTEGFESRSSAGEDQVRLDQHRLGVRDRLPQGHADSLQLDPLVGADAE
jgi:hypothetical protein